MTPSVIKDLTGNDTQTDRSVPKRRKKNQVRKRLAQVRPTCNKPETCNTATQPLSVPDSPALTTALLYETRTDDDSPFPQLTSAAHENLLKARPAMKQLHEYIVNQYDPLENSDSLFQFIKSLPEGSEHFCTGNHSLIMLGFGKNDDVLKIARSENQDNFTRFEREVSLYRRIKNRLEADHPLVLHTCPMRGGFLFAGKRVIAMQKLDFIVNNRLDAMSGALPI